MTSSLFSLYFHSLLGVGQLLRSAAQLLRGSALPVALPGDLVPDASVDPQRPGQGEADPGAGDPAAQRAAHAADEAVRPGHSLQAACAEGVLAVEHSRDPVPAGVLAVAHRALQLLVEAHCGTFDAVLFLSLNGFRRRPSNRYQLIKLEVKNGPITVIKTK